jgi:hypothetical protein
VKRSTNHFLNLDFLEWTESACTCLHVKTSFDIILFTVVTHAISKRLELFSGDVLEQLGTANITCVGVYQEERLDFGDTSDDSSDSDEFA